MYWLIWVFAGYTGLIEGFVLRWLNYVNLLRQRKENRSDEFPLWTLLQCKAFPLTNQIVRNVYKDGWNYITLTHQCETFISSPSLRIRTFVLTHCSRETLKRVISKQCRPRSDAAECGVWSRSSLFANTSAILSPVISNSHSLTYLKLKLDSSSI